MTLKTDALRRILKSFPALLYIAGGAFPPYCRLRSRMKEGSWPKGPN